VHTLRITLIVLLLIVIAGFIFVGLEYKNYKSGNRSLWFGTLNNYQQNQTLKFGNLNLKATSVSLKPYPAPTVNPPTSCLAVEPSGSIIDDEASLDANYACTQSQNTYSYDMLLHKQDNALVVQYTYSNVGNLPLNVGTYKISLLANTSINDDYNCSAPGSSLLKGSSENDCLSGDISKTYKGPLSLIVSQGKEEKEISLKL
jgi:hypothetical protein